MIKHVDQFLHEKVMTVKSLFYPMENGVLWTTFISFLHIFIRPSGLYSPWNSLGQNTEVGSLSLLQGIFPTQGSNPRLPRCRQILNQLSHKGSPRILEWVAYPFSSGSSCPRNWSGVSCNAGIFFTNWAIRKALIRQNNDLSFFPISSHLFSFSFFLVGG